MNPFIIRAITTVILLAALIGALILLSPIQLSILIGAIYLYAFVAEFVPLAMLSIKNTPITTILAGVLLCATGALHVYWTLEYLYLYLYICIGAAVISDIAGYVTGNLLGTHPLAPTISPKKTWEGLAGSIITTSGLFVAITKLFLAINVVIPALSGALLALAALGGDLLISYLKRAAGIKDTGTILPGHGGMLDRLDSIIGTTLVFWLAVTILQYLQ